jgi:hypothetical protein
MWRVGPSVRPRAGGCAQTWATERARGGTVHAADPECAKCELLVEHRRNKTSRGEAPCRSRCCMCCLDGVTLHPSIPPSQGWDAIAAFTVSGTRGGGGGVATLACAQEMAAGRQYALRSSVAATRACARQMVAGQCVLQSSVATTPACAQQMAAGRQCALRSSAAATLTCARQMAAGRQGGRAAGRAAIKCGRNARVCLADGSTAALRAAIKCGRNIRVYAADGGGAAVRGAIKCGRNAHVCAAGFTGFTSTRPEDPGA